MAIWGPGPVNYDNGCTAVGVVMDLLADRIKQALVTLEQEPPPKEPFVLAYIACLRVLGQEFPRQIDTGLRRTEVEAWQEQYDAWYVRIKSKLPAIHREAIREKALEEFAQLTELLG